jgi:hypothetical protein
MFISAPTVLNSDLPSFAVEIPEIFTAFLSLMNTADQLQTLLSSLIFEKIMHSITK